MEEVTFARNMSSLKRSESDILVMCTDAGHNASMMIFYLGKEAEEGLELDFVFSIGNLNNEDGIIPRNELEIIDKGTKQAEKLINWMVPEIKKENPDHRCQSPVTVVEKQTPENSTVRANQSSCNL